MTTPKRALALLSGGQDSTTTLAWALQKYDYVETIGFDYGQRHRVELDCRQEVLRWFREHSGAIGCEPENLGPDHVLHMGSFGGISETALTRVRDIHVTPDALPTTFVPGRNLLFFVYAAAMAAKRGLSVLVGGMCETDYSGYPDCRDNTLKALQVAISLGINTQMVIETPLMWKTKAQTWEMAAALGGQELVELVREHTHTCYIGDHTTKNAWGYGCGNCPACLIRERGYGEWVEGVWAGNNFDN